MIVSPCFEKKNFENKDNCLKTGVPENPLSNTFLT